jgi:hypothetical protein
MARKLSYAENRVVDAFLDTILDGYRAGTLTQSQARDEIAAAVSLAVNDNGNLSIHLRAIVESRGKVARSLLSAET